ncbi:MAG: Sua5/YciO/YrdC/YwlC family protein [Gemmataceae bacterium]|nr:Sua5/YciO/YrdC/YwlC family protein [Gemmataceae bacterium]MCI0743477.1 Sua5/YciO/YrdC/YwlC family protein [Gemmataceae bacterium]
MPQVLDWPPADAPDVLTRAVDYLRNGKVVVFPSEATYEAAACALCPDAVSDLRRVAEPSAAITVVLTQGVEAFDWFPSLRGRGVRLARRFWPGPLVLTGCAGAKQGLAAFLPARVRSAFDEQGLALRLPDHAALRLAARRLGAPLASAATSWTDSDEALAALGDHDVLVRDGPTKLRQSTTLVSLDGKVCQVVRAGAIPAAEIDDAAACQVLFVCTGNTCRSPMAQSLCAQLLAERLGCAAADLPERGFRVQSAGVAAMIGGAATPEALEVVRALGADMGEHRSQPLTHELLAQADFLIGMTHNHVYILHSLRTGVLPRLLSAAGEDIADPIGGPMELYQSCAQQIRECLIELLPELLEG